MVYEKYVVNYVDEKNLNLRKKEFKDIEVQTEATHGEEIGV
jgi:hypothetical protein